MVNSSFGKRSESISVHDIPEATLIRIFIPSILVESWSPWMTSGCRIDVARNLVPARDPWSIIVKRLKPMTWPMADHCWPVLITTNPYYCYSCILLQPFRMFEGFPACLSGTETSRPPSLLSHQSGSSHLDLSHAQAHLWTLWLHQGGWEHQRAINSYSDSDHGCAKATY